MKPPALHALMDGYFHQDWDTYGTELQVVDQFMIDMVSVRASLASEIDALLADDPSEAHLASLLGSMGCQYRPPPGLGGYREWLVRVAARAREHAV